METIEEKDEEENKRKQPIVIELPKWLVYSTLIVLILILTFIVYRILAIPKNNNHIIINDEIFTINCEKQTIERGEILELNVSKYQDIILKSSNPEIIDVSTGKVIGVAEGQASVYALHGDEKSNVINLTCIIEVEDITLDNTALEILINDEKELIAKVVPENATYNELVWKSSSPNIVEVENGKIRGLQEGNSIITVTDIKNTKSASCIVEVKDIPVSSLKLDETNVNLAVGEKYILVETISPNNAINKNIVWTSSNNGIIKVQNGSITALAEGEATVTITSNNGKTASCKFTVTTDKIANDVKYGRGDYNIRRGPGTEYKILDEIKKNDEIEMLLEGIYWSKVRTSTGTVGYIATEGYANSKGYYIDNVPFYNQYSLGYPTGCEAVSATMVANYEGYNATIETIIANTPTDLLGKRQETRTKEIEKEVINGETGEKEIKKETVQETIWVGENPFKYFVGHPTKTHEQGSYGCYAAPISTALTAAGIPNENISGCSIDTVFEYIKQGKPVVIWCRARAKDITIGDTWYYPDRSGSYDEIEYEHCAVLIGYDEDYVYLNDPAVGKGVSQPRGKFTSNWYKLYSQAIIVN